MAKVKVAAMALTQSTCMLVDLDLFCFPSTQCGDACFHAPFSEQKKREMDEGVM